VYLLKRYKPQEPADLKLYPSCVVKTEKKKFPLMRKKSIIVPIYKKDRMSCDNYTGESVISLREGFCQRDITQDHAKN